MICAFQWDLARQAERLSWLLRQLPRYADWGYREVYLHLEDAVEYPSVPGVARPGAYRLRDLGRLADAAGKVGIGVVPIVNLLGHTQYLIRVPALRELNERRGPDGRPMERGQVCPALPRTWEVADLLLRDMEPFCTAGKVHVGLDESYDLGQHPLSRAEIQEVGLGGHFGRYVQRLHGLCAARGLRMGLWADMLALLPEAVTWVPRGVTAYDWYYYPFRQRPAAELHNFAEYDLIPALRAQGVDYWGCPMSGPFRHEPLPTFADRLENIRAWWKRCSRVGAEGMLVTQWEASRVSAPVVQAVDAAAASLWLGTDPSPAAMLADGCRRVFGVGRSLAGRMAQAALAADAWPHAGYFRWELNDRWEYGARGDGAQRERERRFFDRLERRTQRMPEPLAASIRFRAYLARRDAWVTAYGAASARKRVALAGKSRRLREAITAGAAAAQAMWRPSRSGRSPVAAAVRADAKRLAALVRGPAAAVFRFRVHNFAPAMQQVVVEAERWEAGQEVWSVLRARATMEFTRRGATPRAATLVRPLAVPLPLPLPSRLRLAVRGVGEVKVSRCEVLVDGRVVRVGPRRPVRLGSPAPKRGFPPVDWSRNLGATQVIPVPAGKDPSKALA
ncbi:MAG TPA: glycoside hydrolase family 20 [Opitutaceae bacterium]|nr:glycoside hydrolase family 20 [Opitutaceae bacterium]